MLTNYIGQDYLRNTDSDYLKIEGLFNNHPLKRRAHSAPIYDEEPIEEIYEIVDENTEDELKELKYY